MHDFRYIGNKLYCEGVSVETLARKYGTPLFVYSQHTLSEHFRRLDHAMAGVEHLICFAVKSNSNQSVLRTLANFGGGFDIVSGGELQRVINAGGDPGKCAFAGVGKSEGEIEFALALANTRKGAFSRVTASVNHPLQFPAADDIKSAAKIGERAKDRLIRVRLDCKANQVVDAGHGVVEPAKMFAQCVLRIDK